MIDAADQIVEALYQAVGDSVIEKVQDLFLALFKGISKSLQRRDLGSFPGPPDPFIEVLAGPSAVYIVP